MSATSSRPEHNWETLKNAPPLTRDVRAHLSTVYATLVAALVVCAAGVLVDMQYFIGGRLTYIASLAMIVWLAITPNSPENNLKRVGILMGFAFMTGLGAGSLIAMVYAIDPAIIFTSFVGTVCIFASFSAFAMFAERRTHMYLGGVLASCLTAMMWVGIANMFFRLPLLLNFKVYFGLLVFIGFVVYDTQFIIEKALQGNKDFVRHALELFLDFINIFIRLLVILSKNSQSKKKSSNNSRR